MDRNKWTPEQQARMDALKQELHRIPERHPKSAQERAAEVKAAGRTASRRRVLWGGTAALASAVSLAVVLFIDGGAADENRDNRAEGAALAEALYDFGLLEVTDVLEYSAETGLEPDWGNDLEPNDYFDYYQPSIIY